MQANDKRALIPLAAIAAAAIVIWGATSTAFGAALLAYPQDQSGWVYHFQGLIGGFAAFIGATITVIVLLIIDARQARRFREEAEARAVPQRNEIARQTATSIARLRHQLEMIGDLQWEQVRDDFATRKMAIFRGIEIVEDNVQKTVALFSDETFLLPGAALLEANRNFMTEMMRTGSNEEARSDFDAARTALVSAIEGRIGSLQALRRAYGLPD